MLNRVVVALDEAGAYSDRPGCTLDCAAEIAQRTGAQISMVHVEESPSTDLESLTPYRYEGVIESRNQTVRIHIDRTGDELRRFQRRIADKWTVAADTHLESGTIRPTFKRLVRSLGADMLIARFGSEACPSGRLARLPERLMRDARVPILFLPADTCIMLHGLDRALVPLDGSRQAESILPLVRQLLPQHDASVHLLAVVPARARIDVFRRRGVSLTSHDRAEHYLTGVQRPELEGVHIEHTVLMDVEPADAIQMVAERVHANFVAMATRAYTGLPRLLLGSVAHGVLEELRVPLLLWDPDRTTDISERTAQAGRQAMRASM
jgi:nucleotide-binding universal stress UspA family protein